MHCLRTTVDYLDAISRVKLTRSILVIHSGCIGTFKRILEQGARSHGLVMHKAFAHAWPLLFTHFFMNSMAK